MRLPVKSLGAIQCVSKASLNIAGSPGFAALHTLRLLDSATNSGIVESPVPRLMLLAKSRDEDRETLMFQSFNYHAWWQAHIDKNQTVCSCLKGQFPSETGFTTM